MSAGICLWPLSRRKLRSALSIPAAHHRLIILPSRQRFTLWVVSRAIEIMLSMQFVFVERRREPEEPVAQAECCGPRGWSFRVACE